jgi:uncharacterized protein YndB with AHSA1/START domain
MSVPGDRVKVTVSVAVEPTAAFDVFTREVDLWWRRGPAYRRVMPGGVVCIEPRVGGRVFESDASGRVHAMGAVTAWEPPARLAFTWRGANFAEGEVTQVEVRFEAVGEGTRVTLEHSGWSSLRPGHPARHGLEGPALTAMLGRWWADLLTALQHRVDAIREQVPPA